MERETAESLLEHLAWVQCFFVVVKVAPSLGAFTGLQTTMRLHNEEVGSFMDMWDISPDVLIGSAGSPSVRAAVHRLTTVLQSGTLTELKKELDDNGHHKKKHMLTIVKYLLRPLLGCGEDAVVLSTTEYCMVASNIKTDFWGIGNEHMWHGAPDCRCDLVDVANIDSMPPGDDGEVSEAESSGSKNPIEIKPVTLTHLHQIVGNAVTYSFVHNNRHPDQNALVPVLGLSGAQGQLITAMYDCVNDVLCYIMQQKWFNSFAVRFAKEGILMVWLCLHHTLFLKRLGDSEVRSGLHDQFSRDQLLNHGTLPLTVKTQCELLGTPCIRHHGHSKEEEGGLQLKHKNLE